MTSSLEVLRLDIVKVSARIDEVELELAAAQQSGLAATDSYLRDTLLELRKEKNELRKEKNELRQQETLLLQANVPGSQGSTDHDLLKSLHDKLTSLESSLAPKATSIVFSKVTATAATKLLRDLGINEVNGFEHTPLLVDEGLQDFDPFDYAQFPDEDTGTPAFIEYHTEQLRQCGVHIGPGGFKVHDLHKETLYHIEVDGKKYSGGVDGGLTPHSIMASSAGSMLRIGFEHKQSTVDRDAFRARNNLTQGRAVPAKEYTFGEGRAQVVCCLIAAYAMCQFPLDLDLSDGKRHHLLRLRGEHLLEYLDCTPKQAYSALARTLIEQGDLAASTSSLTEPPKQLGEALARPFKKLKGLVQGCALLEQVESAISHSISREQQISTAFEMAMGSEPPMLDCVRAFYGR